MKKLFTIFILLCFLGVAKAQIFTVIGTATNISCNATTGSITANAFAGIPPYTYSIGGAFQSAATFPGLVAGSYTLTAMDSLSNTDSTIVSIISSPPPTIDSIDIIGIGCNTCYDVTVYTSGNSISLNVGGFPQTSGSPFTFCPTVTTTYTVLATDVNGCFSMNNFTLTGGGGSNLSLFATTTSSSCSTGTATLLATGGIPPYVYDVGGVNSSSNVFTNLAIGSHVATVTDSNGCMANYTFVVNNGLSLTNTQVMNCNSTTCTFIASGGVSPYTYFLNSTASSSNVFANVANGTYTATAIDANGCVVTSVLTFFSTGFSLTPTITIISLPCNTNDGVLSVSVPNGTPPYTYLWSNGQTSDNISNLTSGIYSVLVTDTFGCTGSTTIDLQPLLFSAVTARDSICLEDTTLLSAVVNGNLGSGPLQTGYGTSSASSASDEEILNVTLGSFSNTSGCSTTGHAAANGLPASMQSLYSNYTNLFTSNLAQGSTVPISLTLGQCGSSAWSSKCQVWIDFNRDGNLTATEMVFSTPFQPNSVAGTIYNGTVSIPSTALPGSTLMRVVFVESSVVNPTGTYTWGETEDYKVNIGYALQGTTTWYPAASLNTNTGLEVIASPTTTTTYTVVTADTNVCNDTAYVTVNVLNNLAYSSVASVHTNVNCPLSTDGQIAITETSITNTLTYDWSNGTTNAIVSNLGVGAYSVIISDTTGGCIKLYDTIISLSINCGDIVGYVKHDSNDNCMFDVGEPPIPNTMITVTPGNHITFTDANGDYSINGLPYNTYTISKSNAMGFVNNCGAVVTGPVSAANPTLVGNFVDSSILLYNYFVNVWGWCLAPALGNNHRSIYYGHNQPGITSYGTVYAVFDSIQHYGSSVPTHTSISGDTVFWNVNNITNGWSSNYIDVTFALDSTLPMGLIIPFSIGIIYTQFNDTLLSNNFETVNFTTCTSYDPNEKFVTPQGKTNNGYITTADETLTYTVRFQNTGNSTAANVIIEDPLSANLDLASFQVLNASHPYTLEVINNNIIKFKFMGIMLPDSNVDYEGSQGHITFSMKQIPNLNAGDVINNTASIFFDYNAPIITGTTLNTIYDELQAGNSSSQPNTLCNAVCGNGQVSIQANGGVTPLSYIIAPTCATTTITGNLVQNLPAGNYVVTTTDAIGNIVTSNVSVQNNTNTLAIGSVVITPITFSTAGTIDVTANNGQSPYTYNWMPGNTSNPVLSTTVAGSYTCTVTDANGCTVQSVFTLINSSVGINSITKNSNLQLYPNPATDLLTIEASIGLQQVKIMSMVGQTILVVEAGNAHKAIINIKGLSNGVYQVQMQNGAVRKFVVAR
jgi:uncharacterized repeat protein (TIGR01451 family)